MTGLAGTATSSSTMRPPAARRGPAPRRTAGRATRLRRANPQVPVDRHPAPREAQHVGLEQRRVGPGGGQHPEGQVGPDRPAVPCMVELPAEIAGAAGEVEHRRAGRQAEAVGPCAGATDVHAEGHDPVHEVVAGRDGVEHRPHRRHLVVTLGQMLGVDPHFGTWASLPDPSRRGGVGLEVTDDRRRGPSRFEEQGLQPAAVASQRDVIGAVPSPMAPKRPNTSAPM